MSRLSNKSTGKMTVAAPLILALLAGAPFANGLLLHDHSDHGVHSHRLMLSDLGQVGLGATWDRYHDDIHDDDRNDPESNDSFDSLFVLLIDSATGSGIYRSTGAVVSSVQRLSSRVVPQSMPHSDLRDPYRFSTSPCPSARPLHPVSALDALLQGSHALLL